MAQDDDDDYMSMNFAEAETVKHETTAQRRARKQREAEDRARPPPKPSNTVSAPPTEHEALPPDSRGAKLLSKIGYKHGSTLGRADNPNALKQPIVHDVKDDRSGIGHESEKKRKVREAFQEQEHHEKRRKEDEGDFRERVAKEREEKRTIGQVRGAMSVLEGLEEDEDAAQADPNEFEASEVEKPERRKGSKRHVNLLYRSLVRERQRKESERRVRYDLMQSLSKNPSYAVDDGEEDAQDRIALGEEEVDVEEEDPELDALEALDPFERLDQLLSYLREKWHYCFWCKYRYEDESMEGCPGLTEDEHG